MACLFLLRPLLFLNNTIQDSGPWCQGKQKALNCVIINYSVPRAGGKLQKRNINNPGKIPRSPALTCKLINTTDRRKNPSTISVESYSVLIGGFIQVQLVIHLSHRAIHIRKVV